MKLNSNAQEYVAIGYMFWTYVGCICIGYMSIFLANKKNLDKEENIKLYRQSIILDVAFLTNRRNFSL